jgi:hypothetical protein
LGPALVAPDFTPPNESLKIFPKSIGFQSVDEALTVGVTALTLFGTADQILGFSFRHRGDSP